jgi:hypothetical protein
MSGSDALAALEALHGALPKTLTSLTGGGGRHLFFRLPSGTQIGKDSLPVVKAWFESIDESAGGVIDIRNDGFVVLPPSVHKSGNLYRWEDPDVTIATLPLAWCTTPEPIGLVDPERTYTSRTTSEAIVPGDLETRDAIAHELAIVNPDALLGKATLLLMKADVIETTDRSHRIWKIQLGAAGSRFDPDLLWNLLMKSPLKEGCLNHGRDWFDRTMLNVYRYQADHVMAVREVRAAADSYEWHSTQFKTKTGIVNTASLKSMKKVFYVALDVAEQFTTVEPILVKYKIAQATGYSKQTVWEAFQGLIKLGWLEIVHEPEKKDEPWTYRVCLPNSLTQPVR